jgi:ribonuclease PH
MSRTDGRSLDQLRRIKIEKDFLTHPISSVLIEMGGTKVICSVSIEYGVPGWMRAQNVPGGWVTSEYGMLPASTHDRSKREAARGKQSGRTMEIQRLIGRSFRSVIDLNALGSNTVYIDCDVIDADGGTRCASITGASVALQMAFKKLVAQGKMAKSPMKENVAAVSVGIVDGEPHLDLCYVEDSAAEVDMNIVMTESGKFIEIQGTAEENPFSQEELDSIISLAKGGLDTIFSIQKKTVDSVKPKDKPERRREGGRPPRKPPKGLANLGDALNGINIGQ